MPLHAKVDSGGSSRLKRRLVPSRKVAWGLLVLLHLGVFGILYVGALHMVVPTASPVHERTLA